MSIRVIVVYIFIALGLGIIFPSAVNAQQCTGSIKCDVWDDGECVAAGWYSKSCVTGGCGVECDKPRCQFGINCSSAGNGNGDDSDCGNSSAGSCQAANVGDSCGNGGICRNAPNCSCQGQNGGGGTPVPSPTPTPPPPSCTLSLTPDSVTISTGS